MATKKNATKKKTKSTTNVVHIETLQHDNRNANKGTPRGMGMLEESLRSYGAGRSLLIDKNDRIIAGNKTAEVAKDIGIENVRIIETTGDELIAVRRMDLDMAADPRARALGVMDNRVGQVNLDWDASVIAALRDDGVNIASGWLDHEQERMFKAVLNEEVARAADLSAGGGLGDADEILRRANAGEEDAGVDLSADHVRMVQLVFQTTEAHDDFESMLSELGQLFGTETVTDTVWQSINAADEQTRAQATA